MIEVTANKSFFTKKLTLVKIISQFKETFKIGIKFRQQHNIKKRCKKLKIPKIFIINIKNNNIFISVN